jgi:hypothetical protein
MPKRLKKTARPRDVNQLASHLVRITTEQEAPKPKISTELRAYMKALGKRGGIVSGQRRMTNLTADERHKIASKAALAMWAKRRKKA